MGLQVERFSRGKNRAPVADYVLARTDRAPDGSRWEDWLQTHRIELNAMPTPLFIAWLDRKMAQHGVLKLIPPTEVMAQELDERVEDKVRAAITERILREAAWTIRSSLPSPPSSPRSRAARSWPRASSACSSASKTGNGATTSMRSRAS